MSRKKDDLPAGKMRGGEDCERNPKKNGRMKLVRTSQWRGYLRGVKKEGYGGPSRRARYLPFCTSNVEEGESIHLLILKKRRGS